MFELVYDRRSIASKIYSNNIHIVRMCLTCLTLVCLFIHVNAKEFTTGTWAQDRARPCNYNADSCNCHCHSVYPCRKFQTIISCFFTAFFQKKWQISFHVATVFSRRCKSSNDFFSILITCIETRRCALFTCLYRDAYPTHMYIVVHMCCAYKVDAYILQRVATCLPGALTQFPFLDERAPSLFARVSRVNENAYRVRYIYCD